MEGSKIAPGLVGNGRVNTEFTWIDERGVEAEITRLQGQLELMTAYAKKWRARAQQLTEENEALRRQLGESKEAA